MANWMIKSTDVYLSPIYDRLHELIYDIKVIHADESPVKVMRIDHAKIKNGKKTYMWIYRNRPLRGTHPIVLFDWQPSRRSDHPREFLNTFSGTVITDGYQVYHKLAKERRDLKIAGCWVHYLRSIIIRGKVHKPSFFIRLWIPSSNNNSILISRNLEYRPSCYHNPY